MRSHLVRVHAFFALVMSILGCHPKSDLGQSTVANSGFPVSDGSDFSASTVGLGMKVGLGGCSYYAPSSSMDDPSRIPQYLTSTEEEGFDCMGDAKDVFELFCSGVIIGKRRILTAAHCLPQLRTKEEAEKEAQQQAGFHSDAQGSNPESAVVVFPSEVRFYVVFGVDPSQHRGAVEVESAWTWRFIGTDSMNDQSDTNRVDLYTDRANDIAVLSLAGDIPEGFRAVSLPPKADAYVPYDEFRAAWIVGFGRQGNEWRTPATSAKRKRGVMNQNPVTIDKSTSSVHTGVFNVEQSSACHGDSGGPLYKVKESSAKDPSIDYLLGVTSWVADPINCSGDAFYTDIRQYLPFIADPSRYSKPIIFPASTYKFEIRSLDRSQSQDR